MKLQWLVIPSFVKSGFKGLNTLGAVTTSEREFHGFTIRTAKLNFLTSNRDCCPRNFNEWLLVSSLSDNFSIPSQTSES